jgi:choline dehydrogenase-like flavoprotein
MHIDLEEGPPGAPSADVCIVGAGVVGLTLAAQLRDRGMTVLLLERGDADPTSEGVGDGLAGTTTYSGGLKGRAFGFGGTGGLWGGQLVATRPFERQSRAWCGSTAWPIDDAAMGLLHLRAAQWLGMRETDLDQRVHADGDGAGDFDRVFVHSLGFARRNIGAWLEQRFHKDPGLFLALRSRVTGFRFAPDHKDRIASLELRAGHDKLCQVKAAHFVICAGAIESTRLILSLAQSPAFQDALRRAGTGFSDHLSIPVGTALIHDHNAFLQAVAPRFGPGGMIHPRFELRTSAQERAHLPAAFAHFVPRSSSGRVVDAMRRLMLFRQLRKFSLKQVAGALALLLRHPLELARVVWWRLVRRCVYYPPDVTFDIHIDFEQVRNLQNRIVLSEQLDDAGQAKVDIRWTVTEEDERNLSSLSQLFAQDWDRLVGCRVAQLKINDAILGRQSGLHSTPAYDVYHPVGSTAFGANDLDYCVDENLRVAGTDNLYTLSTAVLPSAGSANPTFSAIALAFRLADHLAAISKSPPTLSH